MSSLVLRFPSPVLRKPPEGFTSRYQGNGRAMEMETDDFIAWARERGG